MPVALFLPVCRSRGCRYSSQYRQGQHPRPFPRPVDVSALSEAQMNAEIEKGYADMQAGRTRTAKSVFADLRKDYNL